MDIQWNDSEKVAVTCVLLEIMNIDGVLHPKEGTFMNQYVQMMGVDRTLLERAKDMNAMESLIILRNIDQNKKNGLRTLMLTLMAIDKDLHDLELDTFKSVMSMLGMSPDFSIEDLLKLKQAANL